MYTYWYQEYVLLHFLPTILQVHNIKDERCNYLPFSNFVGFWTPKIGGLWVVCFSFFFRGACSGSSFNGGQSYTKPGPEALFTQRGYQSALLKDTMSLSLEGSEGIKKQARILWMFLGWWILGVECKVCDIYIYIHKYIYIYIASGPLPVTVEKSIFYILTLPKWAPENTPKIHYQFEPWKHNFDTAIFMGPSLDCCECFVAMKRPKPFLRQRGSPNPNKHQTNTHTQPLQPASPKPKSQHNSHRNHKHTHTYTHIHTHTHQPKQPRPHTHTEIQQPTAQARPITATENQNQSSPHPQQPHTHTGAAAHISSIGQS